MSLKVFPTFLETKNRSFFLLLHCGVFSEFFLREFCTFFGLFLLYNWRVCLGNVSPLSAHSRTILDRFKSAQVEKLSPVGKAKKISLELHVLENRFGIAVEQ